MRLYYTNEPPRSINKNHHELTDDDLVWQYHSLPLGNGYLGASVFGYVNDERIQLTDNSFANPYMRLPSTAKTRFRCGVTSFANLYLHFNHTDYTDYTRELNLDEALCRIGYKVGGVSYKREYFTSYPDRVLVMKISADTPCALSFDIGAEIPYIADYCHVPEDKLSRDGSVTLDGEELVLTSRLDYYGVVGYGRLAVRCDGKISTRGQTISVVGATEAVLLYTMGTNYKMESRVFTEPDRTKKLAPYPHPENEVKERLDALKCVEYDLLYERHIGDYSSLYRRASFSLFKASDGGRTTTEVVAAAKAGESSEYLATLLFAFGRYLLIASSRRGALPSNLQGVWSNYRTSPWSAGYWHNINVQMNYWPSWSTNIAECFLSYSDYNTEYMECTRTLADSYLRAHFPDREIKPKENGWIIGTGGWPYAIDGAGGHSGPGTGAFTSLLFWDYYDYTRDYQYLKEKAYPVLRDMSLFFSRTVARYGEKYLVTHSASPEQYNGGEYYQTVGCAFDQQMIYENYKRTLEAAEILGVNEPLLDVIREQIDKLDPILIGLDGQIKEYREEEHYGDIGEAEHRHISHLVALYPGCSINETTPELMDAARYSLKRRGDGSSGWSAAHRLLCYARLGEGDSCYRIVKRFMQSYVTDNLWTQHPPYQIDGSFGITAGISEMLLQSHSGYIRLLPAMPKEWQDGEFCGLVTRGGFVVDCSFRDRKPKRVKILCRVGGRLTLCAELDGATLVRGNSRIALDGNELKLDTNVGEELEILFDK